MLNHDKSTLWIYSKHQSSNILIATFKLSNLQSFCKCFTRRLIFGWSQYHQPMTFLLKLPRPIGSGKTDGSQLPIVVAAALSGNKLTFSRSVSSSARLSAFCKTGANFVWHRLQFMMFAAQRTWQEEDTKFVWRNNAQMWIIFSFQVGVYIRKNHFRIHKIVVF